MYKKSTLLIVLIIGLASISALSYSVQPVKAVYNVVEIDINADGSITPADAPIDNINNTFYTLTDDVNITGWAQPYDSAAIRIKRGNIIFNGNGYIITNSGGFDCFIVGDGVNNVTIENSTGIGFNIGLNIASDYNTFRWNNFSGGNGVYEIVRLSGAGNNYFEGNIMTDGVGGVNMWYWGPNNTFVGNYIVNKAYSVLWGSAGGGAKFYHNVISGIVYAGYASDPDCTWDNGYPSGGNYWIGYVGEDKYSGPYQNITGRDGIGDTPRTIDADNIDHYPLMMLDITNVTQMPPSDNVLSTDTVEVNATVTHHLPLEQVILNCTHTNSTATWTDSINMTNLEGDIWNGIIPALPVGTNVTYAIIAQDDAGNSINSKNQGYTFDYPVVIPEFSSFLILPLFLAATALAVMLKRRAIQRT